MLKRFAPKSLYGRTILIVVLPIFLMQAVVTFVFFNRHWEEVTSSLAKGTASEIGLLTLHWTDRSYDMDRVDLIRQAGEELDVAMSFVQDGQIPSQHEHSFFDALNRTLDRELDWSLDYPYWYDTTGFDGAVEIRVQLPDGYLQFRIARDRVVARNGHFFVLWLIGATLLLGYVALVFLRNQVRSITRLAAAAEAFGRGEDMGDYKPSGAREVRQAGHAFIAMRARIRRFLEQRTEMLAGVSHDLKTPLTRMRINLALQDETDDIADMKGDIDDMERLLEDYLVFARGESETQREWIDLSALCTECQRTARRLDRHLEVDAPASTMLFAQRSGIVRVINNLLENGYKFADTVTLSVRQIDRDIEITVDDDGPGIEDDLHDAAIKAFGRLDDARSLNTGGSGLGLAIVRDVARAHGGNLQLGRSPLGGLRASIIVPVGDGPRSS